jgi:hypothetical protein
MQPTAFPPHSYSANKLGSAGAKELVKGDWPELRVLNIGWGVLGWCLCVVQYTAGRVRLEICLDVTTSVCVCYMQFQPVGRRGGSPYCNWKLANVAEPYIKVSAAWLHDL